MSKFPDFNPEYFQTAENIIRQAGELAAENFTGNFAVSSKSPGNPVTEIDWRIENMIYKKISSKFPDHSFLSEEKIEDNRSSDYRWILDPIDGTSNYIRGIPFFAVSLALCYQDRPLMGMIYHPLDQSFFSAWLQEGAWLDGKPISIAERTNLKKSCLAVELIGSEIEMSDGFPNFDLQNKVASIRALGSQSLGLAYTAAGNFDLVCFLRTNFWDFAAGLVILKEAGSKVTNLSSSHKPQKDWKTIAAGNQELLQKFIQIIPLKRGDCSE